MERALLPSPWIRKAALRRFYASRADTIDDPDVAALLAQLADVETHHKARLFALYEPLAASPVDKESFESHIVTHVMEGGFTAEELQAQHPSAFQSAVGALTLAMTLEAQAMDLYLRYAEKSENVEVKKILYLIADDEKAHLNALGELMERKS
jgi:rubrerythrin